MQSFLPFRVVPFLQMILLFSTSPGGMWTFPSVYHIVVKANIDVNWVTDTFNCTYGNIEGGALKIWVAFICYLVMGPITNALLWFDLSVELVSITF